MRTARPISTFRELGLLGRDPRALQYCTKSFKCGPRKRAACSRFDQDCGNTYAESESPDVSAGWSHTVADGGGRKLVQIGAEEKDHFDP